MKDLKILGITEKKMVRWLPTNLDIIAGTTDYIIQIRN